MCLLAKHMPSLEKCLFRSSAYFKIRLLLLLFIYLFFALPGKEGHRGLMVHKLCSNLGEFREESYSNGSRVELLTRIRVCAGPALL